MMNQNPKKLSRNKMQKRLKTALIICLASPLMLFIAVISLQDFIIFPEVLYSKILHTRDTSSLLPEKYTSTFLNTRDGQTLELLRYNLHESNNKKITTLFFHGNLGSVRQFLNIQTWFGNLGTNSLQVDYRGYGNSSGWPS